MKIYCPLAISLLLVSLVGAEPSTAPSGALRYRLDSLQQLDEARGEALVFIRDTSRYTSGEGGPQREANRLTAVVSQAYAKVDAQLKKDCRNLQRKKSRAALQLILEGAPEQLNVWERRIKQRLADQEVLEHNRALLRAKPRSMRPLPFQLEQLRITNQYRMLLGLKALSWEGHLVSAAASHSEEMLQLNYFDHVSPVPERRTPFARASLAGFKGSAVGENIAQGYRSPKAVHRGWLTSPGHHRNILDADWECMGVAFSRDTWTQVFGRVSEL